MATNYSRSKQMLLLAMKMIREGSKLYDEALEIADNTDLTEKQNQRIYYVADDFYQECVKENQFYIDCKASENYDKVMTAVGW